MKKAKTVTEAPEPSGLRQVAETGVMVKDGTEIALEKLTTELSGYRLVSGEEDLWFDRRTARQVSVDARLPQAERQKRNRASRVFFEELLPDHRGLPGDWTITITFTPKGDL